MKTTRTFRKLTKPRYSISSNDKEGLVIVKGRTTQVWRKGNNNTEFDKKTSVGRE